ncbi:hypothetical protein EJB05_21991, partial [Eragrostis curvula]
MRAAGGGSTFRWLDAARYAVAAVLTVLIVAVIVNAIKVVLRPDSLRLWVVEGAVSSTPLPPEEAVTLGLNLRAENPSGRVRMYLLNITAYLFNNKTVESTTEPADDCIIFFRPGDVAVAQQVAVDTITQVNGTNDDAVMDPFYFDILYAERSVIRDAAMRVEGTLVTEVRSGINRTRPGTTYYCWPLVVGGKASGTEDDNNGYTLVAISSLKAKAVCSGHRVPVPPNRTWVPLSHLHGSCSPSSSARGKPPPLAELLRQDQLRVDDIQTRLSGVADEKKKKKHAAKCTSTQMNTGPVLDVNMGTSSTVRRKPPSYLDRYAVPTRFSICSSITHKTDDKEVTKGKISQSQQTIRPAATGGGGSSSIQQPGGVSQTVMVDTASDVPWVRCLPCPNPPCPSYDPARSSTYAAFPCNSTDCARLGSHANGCVSNQCQYRASSPDGLTSSGTYGSDVLTIGAGATNTIRRFKFGCSHAEQGSIGSSQQNAAGIMALGGGRESLVSQTAATYGNAFSYCIPPTTNYPGFFSLGSPIAESSRFVLTPMLRDGASPATFHRVLLRDITVAGKNLGVPTEVFAAGAVLDSRTAITRLPLTAYDALRAEFRSRMAAYRAAPPKGNLDTCFDFTGVPVVTLPRVELVFDQDAVVELDASGVLFNDCLAFAANADDVAAGVLGNVQQQTIEVLYDVGGGAVGFRRIAC